MTRSEAESAVGAVLVVGGGISGIQSALDLANVGFKVYLVEKFPIIGGEMARLDKTFPTLDCSLCIQAPKMAEAGRHPNIRILANTEVEKVEGEVGNFTVTVIRKPRYVNEDLCVGCGTCTSYCPYDVLNPFDENLSTGKAIDNWCRQAVPSAAVIDKEACLRFQDKCGICTLACQTQAIDFSQKRKRGVIQVGAIIVSPGYETSDAKARGAYGYGRMKNVVTSLEFERILSAFGPNQGRVLRRSDGKVPSRIAWIQCVGSRDTRFGSTYCSGVCCTYALKQMLLVKNYYPETQVAIFHNDIRTFGKGFEDMYNRLQEMEGVYSIRKRIAEIKENQKNDNLILTYTSDDGHNVRQEEFDMVVLSVGMRPSGSNRALAQLMGLELSEHGFCKTSHFSSNETNRPGIFPAATFTAPMDIPDSISSASSAAAAASQLLSSQRGALTEEKVYPDERSVDGEEPRIGVFVCKCGTNIGGVVDVAEIVAYASTLEKVIHSEQHSISCASEPLGEITETIREKGLNRVVVAACSPTDHEAVFSEAVREAGLNPYLLDVANIREHCSWVHSHNRDEATQKAKDIVGMSVARARNLTPLQELKLPVDKRGLVLGGGLAGMQAALALGRQGFQTYLVEKNEELGGQLRTLHWTLEGMEVQPFLRKLIHEVEAEENIQVFKGYELKSFGGYTGNFKSTIVRADGKDDEATELEHGVTIVATGGKLLTEPAEYRYGESKKIVTQQELEGMIASDALPRDLKQVAMIQCVRARNEERPYCSRICCGEAVKNALKLKEMNDNIDVTIFHRDMRTYGFMEDYYLKAREKGVLFLRYEPDRKVGVDLKGDELSLAFYDSILDTEIEINLDLLALSTPVIPDGNQELAQLLKVQLDKDGFFMEAHPKLRPLDFATDGIFLCGMAHYPKYIPETISQANGAALRAATVLLQDYAVASGSVCEINEDECIGCGLCAKVCPYGAIELEKTEGGKVARITPPVCKGCGVCNAVCPTGAISLKHFTDSQIIPQIDAAYSVPLLHESKSRILGILCNWCGYRASDMAGVSRFHYASNIRIIRVMCSGRVHPKFIYEAFLKGLDAVLVVGCHPQDCHYISGVNQTMKTIPSTQKNLEKVGINSERVRLEYASAAEGVRFAEIVNAYDDEMTKLGRLELTEEQRGKLLELKQKKAKARQKKGDS